MSVKSVSSSEDFKLMKSNEGSEMSLMQAALKERDHQISSMQAALKERDHQISSMQSTISRLEMKNKEYSAYETMVLEAEERISTAESEVFRATAKMREKQKAASELKVKLQAAEKKISAFAKTSTSVSRQEYNKVKDEMMRLKQICKKAPKYESAIEELEKQLRTAQEAQQIISKENDSVRGAMGKKEMEIIQLRQQLHGLQEETSKNIRSQASIANSLAAKSQLYLLENDNALPSSKELRELGNIQFQKIETQKELRRYQFEVESYAKENEKLRVKCQMLEHKLEQYKHSSSDWSIEEKNKEHIDMIRRYEEHIESMAAKLSSVHKVEMEKRDIDLERRKYIDECDAMRQELVGLRSYCDNLEQQIRAHDQYRSLYLEADMQRFISQNAELAQSVEKLNATVWEKSDQLQEVKANFTKLTLTEQKIEKMDLELNSIENTMAGLREELRKEQEKVYVEQDKFYKLQKEFREAELGHSEVKSELAKLNRTISQKVQKIELQSMEINRLGRENEEKLELSQVLSKLQKKHKELEAIYDEEVEQCNELAATVIVLSAEIERMSSGGLVSKELMAEFDQMKKKSTETEGYITCLEERIKRLEHLHKQVVQETTKLSEHLLGSHKRWNHYDAAMEEMNSFLENVMRCSDDRYNELEENIEKWLQMQEARVKELYKGDQFEQKNTK